METLKYKVIKTKSQYHEYCDTLEKLLEMPAGKTVKEQIELLTVLIEKYDEEHNTFGGADPVIVLKALMKEQHIKAVGLAAVLGVSKGLVSDILNYKKGMSKEVIRLLAAHFKVSQETFNRPYELKLPVNGRLKKGNAIAMTKLTRKAA